MKLSQTFQGKAFFVLAAALAVLAQPGCRSLQHIPSQWLTAPAAADGRLEDFSKKITSHLFENGLMVGVGNDDRFLYVFFSPDVRHRQRPPSNASLTLWLDENGGKAERLGLVYVSNTGRQKIPGPGESPAGQKDLAGQPAGSPAPPSPPAAAAATVLKIVDRKNGKETFINAEGSLGPAVRQADDWGDFAYQWRIPFQALGDWPGLNCDPGKALGIGLVWKITPLPGFAKKEAYGRFPGGPEKFGTEMGSPPGMDGGPGRGMPRDNFKSRRRVWLKTTLANKM